MGRWFYVWAKQCCKGSRQKLLFIPQHDNWRLDSQSVVTLYEHIWGFGRLNCKGIKKKCHTHTGLCSFFYLFNNVFSSFYYPERLYVVVSAMGNKCFLFSRLIKMVSFCFSVRESKYVCRWVVCWLHVHKQTKVTERRLATAALSRFQIPMLEEKTRF